MYFSLDDFYYYFISLSSFFNSLFSFHCFCFLVSFLSFCSFFMSSSPSSVTSVLYLSYSLSFHFLFPLPFSFFIASPLSHILIISSSFSSVSSIFPFHVFVFFCTPLPLASSSHPLFCFLLIHFHPLCFLSLPLFLLLLIFSSLLFFSFFLPHFYLLPPLPLPPPPPHPPPGLKTPACSSTRRASLSGLWCWVTSRGRGQRPPTGWDPSVVMETVSPALSN